MARATEGAQVEAIFIDRSSGGTDSLPVRRRARMPRCRPLILGAAALSAALWAYACGDGTTEPAAPPPDSPRATTVTVTPATAQLAALGIGVQLSAEVRDQNGNVIAGGAVAWSSSDASVATVDASGLAMAAGNGTATITATAGSASGTASVTVAQVVSAVEVSPSADTLVAVGDTARFATAAFDQNGHVVPGAQFSWSSSDTLVAAVDGAGLVTAIANGTATITATSGSASGSATAVVAQQVTSVTVSPPAHTLAAGDTLRLAAAASDGNGHAVAGAAFMWTSSDTRVALVDDAGLVTAVGTGEAEVSATSAGRAGSAALTVVGKGPDLVVDLLTDGPVRLQIPDALNHLVRLGFRVHNRGDATAPGTWLRYYLSPDSAIGTDDAEAEEADRVRSLRAGSAASEWTLVTVPSRYGRYYYGACVEPVLGESDLSNNCSAVLTVIGFPRGEIIGRDEQSLTIQMPTLPETRIELYRSTSLTGDYLLVNRNIPALDKVTVHVDGGLQSNTIYYYNAKICGNTDCSSFSAAWAGLTEAEGPVAVPPTPTSVRAEQVDIRLGTDDARVWWAPAPRATYYEVYQQDTGHEEDRLDAEVSAPAASYYDSKPNSFLLVMLTTRYRVRACNKAGCSAYSAAVWVG